MFLCLDLSSKCTGYSKFSTDGKLLKYDRIIPDENVDPLFKLHYVVTQVKSLYQDVDHLVIEGIFLGRFAGKSNVTTFEYLAKLAGAVIYTWVVEKYTLPIIYKAVESRKLAGIKGTCQKAEVQLWVVSQYGFADSQTIEEWQTIMDSLTGEYVSKEITLNQFKYRAGRLSEIIDQATGIGEDIADSIVLGRAFINGGENDRPTKTDLQPDS